MYLGSSVSEGGRTVREEEKAHTASKTLWTPENESFGAMTLPERHYF